VIAPTAAATSALLLLSIVEVSKFSCRDTGGRVHAPPFKATQHAGGGPGGAGGTLLAAQPFAPDLVIDRRTQTLHGPATRELFPSFRRASS
jgi:hypothetical protein